MNHTLSLQDRAVITADRQDSMIIERGGSGKTAVMRDQTSRTAMTKPSTSTATPSPTQSARCFSILTRIHSP